MAKSRFLDEMVLKKMNVRIFNHVALKTNISNAVDVFLLFLYTFSLFHSNLTLQN